MKSKRRSKEEIPHMKPAETRNTPFNFLGFTIRYDTDLNGGSHKYLNIHPSKKSEQKLRDKVKDYLHRHGHSKARQIAGDLKG
jgi:hypothetical protein